MITDNELRISNESYTHKDFYQIYPEILDLVKKITERWSPADSNESDPGVVLLKLLAFIADKTNYNIDKNILEIFMSSATQQESMRKLCEMMGYNMKYYQSATVDVSFMWSGDSLKDHSEEGEFIQIEPWTELTDDSGEVVYTVPEAVQLSFKGQTITKQAIEGKLCDVIINDDNRIKLFNLDDNLRFYLPESKIAENGIWIKNTEDEDWTTWTKVENLNVTQPGTPVWKFGYSSKKALPYIQFPDDIADLIGDGLEIKYIRTSGTNGNITAKALNALSSVTELRFYNPYGQYSDEKGKPYDLVPVSEDSNYYLVIENSSYTMNGQDIETLDEAFNNFKKTVGTFDTLVTCRDYANKIYQLTYNNTNRSTLVSNVQVSDIKDDINFATKIVSFDDFGILYSDVAVLNNGNVANVSSLPTYPPEDQPEHVGEVVCWENNYYVFTALGASKYSWILTDIDALKNISNFDIYIYPLKDITNYYKGNNYKNSFKPNYLNSYEIVNQLQDYKTLSHNIKQLPNRETDEGLHNIYNIKNYYHLEVNVTTTYKVTEYEGVEILNNIYYALWNTFNARKVDYGEELSEDMLIQTMQNADERIKYISLNSVDLRTSVMYADGKEIDILDTEGNIPNKDIDEQGQLTGKEKELFLHLIAKNVLAGRLPLFNYDTRFKYQLGTKTYTNTTTQDTGNRVYGNPVTYPTVLPSDTSKDLTEEFIQEALGGKEPSITSIDTDVIIPTGDINYTLRQNEVVNIICPNLKSDAAFTTYTNYYFESNGSTGNTACHFTYLHNAAGEEAQRDAILICLSRNVKQEDGSTVNVIYPRKIFTVTNDDDLGAARGDCTRNKVTLFKQDNSSNNVDNITVVTGSESYAGPDFTYFAPRKITEETFLTLQTIMNKENIYKLASIAITNEKGELVDDNHKAFANVLKWNSSLSYYLDLSVFPNQNELKQRINNITIPEAEEPTVSTVGDTRGITSSGTVIEPETEYELRRTDKLYLNWTDSDEVVHDVLFYTNSAGKHIKQEYLNFKRQEPQEWAGIIKPNFKLQQSDAEKAKRSFSKNSGSYFIDKGEYDGEQFDELTGALKNPLPGMFTLSGTQQIETRDWVHTNIKTSPFYCYWSTNNHNTIKFKQNLTTDEIIYEYLLGTDEYFFYTDSLKQTLVTLGSGIKLRLHYLVQPRFTPEWPLETSDVSLDDIASKGIGAFSDTKWRSFKFTENFWLEIQDNQIISLAEGAVIEKITLKNDDDISDTAGCICNKWKSLNADPEYTRIKDVQLPNLQMITPTPCWVQSVLNLNMSSTEGQPVNEQTKTDVPNKLVKRKFVLWTSMWKNSQGRYEDYDPEKDLTEESLQYKTFESKYNARFDGKDVYYLKSNYALSQAGGKQIDLHRYTIEEKLKDDLYIYPFEVSAVEAYPVPTPQTTSNNNEDEPAETEPKELLLTTYNDEYYKIPLKNYVKIVLPLFVPKATYGLLMLYYTPSEGVLPENYVRLLSIPEEGETETGTASINFFGEATPLPPSAGGLKLKKGINIIKLWEKSSILRIKKMDEGDIGSIVCSDLSVVKNPNNSSGINTSLLNIKEEDVTQLLQIIKDIDYTGSFFYNNPINKYSEVDVNVMDQYSFFNYNNVCNKFTIAEVDTDKSNIQISKASRISKW